MKKSKYGFWLGLLLFIPLISYSQIPWSPVEDTCYVPDLYGTGLFLNVIIAADTGGTGWQGANGATTWQNHTRVYVLQKFGMYPWNAQVQLRTNRKLVIRAEDGNYRPGGDWRPQIYAYPVSGTYPGRIVNLNQLGDTLILQNISVCGMDESQAGGVDKIQGNLIEIQSTGSGSIYLDGCIVKTDNGQLMQIGASGACHAYTIRATNTLFADGGFLGMSNLGAGRGIDCRNSEVDSLDVENCTFVNFQDRVIRHYLSLQPIHSIKFNHNTVINSMSYCGTISLGWVDSLSNGPCEIKDNLFLDNFAMGPDTDLVRQGEFSDNPEKDPVNGSYKMSWIVVRPNTTAHLTPWVISNNYYGISDSGVAMRNLTSPYLRTPVSTLYPGAEEPILTSDLKRQVALNGGDTLTAFRKVTITPVKVPPLMTNLIRWYYTVEGDGTGGNDKSNVGAGAGRKKTGSSGTPASHFIHDATNNVWVYDYNRQTTAWYMDSLNASFSSTTNLVAAASDGKIVGDPRWSFTLIPVVNFAVAPKTIDFGTIAKNTSKLDSVVVSNSGNSTLVIDSVRSRSAAEFTISPTSGAIGAGGTAKFYITYLPTTPGAKSSSVVFYYKGTSSSQDTVSVSGNVVAVVDFEASSKVFDFGSVYIGQNRKDSLTVSNHGTLSLTISAVTSTNTVFSVTPISANVDVEGAQKFYITFVPVAAGLQSGKIILTHNAASSPDTVNVSGTGSVVPVPAFSVVPASINFGTLPYGSTKKDSVLVSNPGTAELQVTAISSTNARFTFAPATMTLATSGSAYLVITFAPLDTTTQSGSIILTHNAVSSPDSIAVRGKGSIPVGVEGMTQIPTVYALRQNYPNPFNPSTTILYDLPQQSKVVLKVYSILGQEVTTLVDGVQDAGYRQVVWKGQYDSGKQVASGIYLFRIFAQPTGKGEAFTQVRKMLLVK